MNSPILFGQEQEEPMDLIQSLERIQEQYQIQFNYSPEILSERKISRPRPDLSLEELLEYLQTETGLRFTRLSEGIIGIAHEELLICGYLKDKDTGEPLSYATILGAKNAVITNNEGFFKIPFSSEDELIQIRHVGYKTLERQASFFQAGSCGNIYLIPQQEMLSEIILYDYLIRGMDKIDNGGIAIDFDRFSLLPGLIDHDVLQSVQALPGVQSLDETVSDINIRGGSNDQNLIMWDGIKMYQSGHFFGLISLYNPQITDRVVLKKNGTDPALTDGVSGTIAMFTDNEIAEDIYASAGINLLDVNGFVDLPLGANSSIQLAGRKGINEWFETPTYTEYLKRISRDTELENNASDIGFDFYDASLRWIYSPGENDRIQLNALLANNRIDFNENALLGESTVQRASSIQQNSLGLGLSYLRQWNKAFSSELQVYNSEYKLQAINANIEQDQRFLQENKVSETGIRAGVEYQWAPNFRLHSGYQFIETKVTNLDDVDDPRFVRLFGNVLRSHALYGELKWESPNRNTNLNLGGRATYLDKFNRSIIEPRISFNQKFLKNFNLELLAEMKHQTTSQIINFQNDFLGIEKRRWQLSDNDSIPVIQGQQVSAGISFKRNGWLLDLVGFLKEVDGVTSQSQGFQGRFQDSKALGSYQAYGLEALFKKQLLYWEGWLSYTLLESDYEFPTLWPELFTNNFEIQHSLTSGLTYSRKRFIFSGGINWRSGRPINTLDLQNPVTNGNLNFQSPNSGRSSDYLRMDISGEYRFNIRQDQQLKIGVAIWNITNRNNEINRFFISQNPTAVETIIQSSLGITPNLLLRWEFGK